jgi:uncharacterized protein YecE (DUF72 family)
MIKVGLCGFTMPVREYYETFPVVEIQQTFYQPPAERTLLGYRERAPEGFEFTMKAWQLITHRATSNTYRRLRTPLTDREREEVGAFQVTDVVLRAWQTTLRASRIVRATAILFQCPASFRATDENLEAMRRYFNTIERPEGVRLLWESRGPWPAEMREPICRELGLVDVVDPFVRDTTTPELTYWRLHGIGSHYRPYTEVELRDLAGRVRGAGEAYVMFNNIPRVADAQRFVSILRQNT